MFTRTISLAFGALALSAAAQAQTNFPESEPNDTKAAADAVGCLAVGDTLSGTTTGSSTVTPGLGSADYFDVAICPAPVGLYRNRLTLTSTPAGHTATIRGFTSTGGLANTTTDAAQQTSLTTTTPPRYVQWDGFGQGEHQMFRVSGLTTTTAAYTATFSSTPLVPTAVPGSFNAGLITISTVGQTTTDTEIYLYDSNWNWVPTGHNDDESPVASVQSRLARTLPGGTYFVGIQRFEFSNGESDVNTDESYLTGTVNHFTLSAISSSGVLSQDLDFTITDGSTTTPVTAVNTAAFDIMWFSFTVATPAAFGPFCTNASLTVDHTTLCPCANPGAPGNGCAHSFDVNGANMNATGTAAADDVILDATNMPASAFCLMMQHDALGDTVFHDGVLCAGGTLTRLRGRNAVGGQAIFPNSAFPNDATLTLSQRGGVTVGSGARRYYAAFFRNASTTFCPPATANVTNGWVIDW